jgi:hypothetical protein
VIPPALFKDSPVEEASVVEVAIFDDFVESLRRYPGISRRYYPITELFGSRYCLIRVKIVEIED